MDLKKLNNPKKTNNPKREGNNLLTDPNKGLVLHNLEILSSLDRGLCSLTTGEGFITHYIKQRAQNIKQVIVKCYCKRMLSCNF